MLFTVENTDPNFYWLTNYIEVNFMLNDKRVETVPVHVVPNVMELFGEERAR